jgi:nicotinamide mononucleotide transporter
MKFKQWFKDEYLIGYTLFEKVFMVSLIILQIVVFILNPDSVLGFISGLSGVISVVLCAKGKISFYYIGFVQTITYIILAWQNKFYGEVIENIFYLVTMVIGVVLWHKHMNKTEDSGTQVQAKRMSMLQWIITIILTLGVTAITGILLRQIGNAQPFTDATTNVLAVFAQLLMINRYREQWIWWILIDIICIKMWIVAGNVSMIVMYIAWTINCIYGWYNWSKLNRVNTAGAQSE